MRCWSWDVEDSACFVEDDPESLSLRRWCAEFRACGSRSRSWSGEQSVSSDEDWSLVAEVSAGWSGCAKWLPGRTA